MKKDSANTASQQEPFVTNEQIIDDQLKQFAPSAQSFGFASTKKQTTVNIIIIAGVIFSFTMAIYYKGFLQALSLEVGLFLLSIKLAYFMHNVIKFNHYLFWILNSLEMHMLNIKKEVDTLSDQVSVLSQNTDD